MAQGFDCATKLNSTSAKALKAAGFDYVARYLGNSWKTFDAAEAQAIQSAGLNLISIFEKNSTKASYFSKAQGMADAQEAYKYAKAVGQPAGSAIYFTVDYNAQLTDLPAILEYVEGVKQLLVDYKVGLYGSYAVMQAVKGHVDYYWQTCAWSNHLVADFVHMYQQQGSPTIAGIQIDKNDIKMDPGAWGQQKVNAAHIAEPVHTESAPLKVIGRVKVIATDLRMRKGPGLNFPVVGEAVTGKIYNVYAVSDQWHQIGAEQWVWGEGGKYLELITDEPVYYVIQSGDALSKIASHNGTTVKQLQAWNNIKDPNKIYAGQKIRIK
jgi:nucleoid-associated protein YgaU